MVSLRIALLATAAALATAGAAFADTWDDGKLAYGKRDFAQAGRLFRAMAEAGDPRGQEFLGIMYHDGEGMAADKVRADMWFRLAASLFAADSEDAKEARDFSDVVETDLTPDQIKTARDLAAQCQARHYKACP